jgi:uncharacterized membrane protein YccC
MRSLAMIPAVDIRHGAQLAAAVVLSYLASAAFGLPEGFWAVMSALIVTRPDTGATLGAGWDRIRGTLLGTMCGLAGVWLSHVGLGAPAATLAIVAMLAFASAGVPILRSAPITALIVLSSGGIAGHSAMQVAGLRVAEIGIGVTIGLAISVALPAARAGSRFDAECAAVLRMVAAQMSHALGENVQTEDERDAERTEMRAALRRLLMLGNSATQESKWSLRRLIRRVGGGASEDAAKRPPHDRIAKLVMRTSQDAAMLGRVFAARDAKRPAAAADTMWDDLRDAADGALTRIASELERKPSSGAKGTVELGSLRRIEAALTERRLNSSEADDVAVMLACPLRWLVEDLASLGRVATVRSV